MICKTIALRDDHPGVTLSTFLWEPSPELVQSPRPAVLDRKSTRLNSSH